MNIVLNRLALTAAFTQLLNAMGLFGAVVPVWRKYYLLGAARTP